jgi:hypothetical protein
VETATCLMNHSCSIFTERSDSFHQKRPDPPHIAIVRLS